MLWFSKMLKRQSIDEEADIAPPDAEPQPPAPPQPPAGPALRPKGKDRGELYRHPERAGRIRPKTKSKGPR